ncbi:putative mitochondrial protein [Senna tora]|uniref:Putative mitochondrial protein n=1 Tax=Senna tora TaxID=362788 RepID=A0A834T107_9FABA|nr:putative mitochondrial protein [Senna tora]
MRENRAAPSQLDTPNIPICHMKSYHSRENVSCKNKEVGGERVPLPNTSCWNHIRHLPTREKKVEVDRSNASGNKSFPTPLHQSCPALIKILNQEIWHTITQPPKPTAEKTPSSARSKIPTGTSTKEISSGSGEDKPTPFLHPRLRRFAGLPLEPFPFGEAEPIENLHCSTLSFRKGNLPLFSLAGLNGPAADLEGESPWRSFIITSIPTSLLEKSTFIGLTPSQVPLGPIKNFRGAPFLLVGSSWLGARPNKPLLLSPKLPLSTREGGLPKIPLPLTSSCKIPDEASETAFTSLGVACGPSEGSLAIQMPPFLTESHFSPAPRASPASCQSLSCD